MAKNNKDLGAEINTQQKKISVQPKRSYLPELDQSILHYKRYGEINLKEVGERLYLARKKRGASMETMAIGLGVSASGYRKLEAGNAVLNGRILVTLYELYGIDIIWLLFGTHSSHEEICSALFAADDQCKFDIFTRLFSYFITKDDGSFVASNGRIAGIQHFAKWDETFFRPLAAGEPADDEVSFSVAEDYDSMTSIMNEFQKMDPEQRDGLMDLLHETIKKNK